MFYQLNERHCTICGATVRLLGDIVEPFDHVIGRKLGCPNKCFHYEQNGDRVTIVLTLRPATHAYRIKFQGNLKDDAHQRKILKESIGRVERIARRLYWEFGHGDAGQSKN